MLAAWVAVGTRRVGASVGYLTPGVEDGTTLVTAEFTAVVDAGATIEVSDGLVVSPPGCSVGTDVSVSGGTGLAVGVAAGDPPGLRSANAIERLPSTSTMDRTA